MSKNAMQNVKSRSVVLLLNGIQAQNVEPVELARRLGSRPRDLPKAGFLLYLYKLACDVLRPLAYANKVDLPARRDLLQYVHPDDRPIEEEQIAAQKAFANALLDFLHDPEYRKYVECEAARQGLKNRSG
jgi:hypothetical protein